MYWLSMEFLLIQHKQLHQFYIFKWIILKTQVGLNLLVIFSIILNIRMVLSLIKVLRQLRICSQLPLPYHLPRLLLAVFQLITTISPLDQDLLLQSQSIMLYLQMDSSTLMSLLTGMVIYKIVWLLHQHRPVIQFQVSHSPHALILYYRLLLMWLGLLFIAFLTLELLQVHSWSWIYLQ